MILIYLDPGSGSFLIQLLIAGLAGAGIAIAASWSKIKRLWNKNKKAEVDPDEDEEVVQAYGGFCYFALPDILR